MIRSKPHPIFKSALVAMLVARIQKSGKRSVAEQLILDTMKLIERKTDKPALVVLEIAVRKLMPDSSLVSQRVSGSVQQVPRSILTTASVPLAIKWLVTAAKSKKSKTISEALALEIIDVFNGQGTSVTKLQQNKRMSAANLVYAHLIQQQQNRTSRGGSKIFQSRPESKEQQSVQRLSVVQDKYEQIDESPSKQKQIEVFGMDPDRLWFPEVDELEASPNASWFNSSLHSR